MHHHRHQQHIRHNIDNKIFRPFQTWPPTSRRQTNQQQNPSLLDVETKL